MITSIAKKVFGTKNDREVKKYLKIVTYINELEPKYEKMSNEEIQHLFA